MSKILVVDDESAVRSILSRFLRREGHEVSTASGGREGIERVAAERPSILIMDLMMPELNGLELLKAARRAQPELAVIVVTARPESDLARETVKERAYDYIAKPIDLDYLKAAVRRLARGRG